MAYFLGRDVVVAMTTEDASALICSVSNAAALVEEASYASQTVIAGPRLDLGAGTSTFGTQTTSGGSNPTFTNETADLTGVDFTNADLYGANLTGANIKDAILDCHNHEICNK